MEIKCSSRSVTYDTGENYYSCEIKDQQIPENQDLVFVGPHESGMSNSDVTLVFFNNCQMTNVPQGLTKLFPKLKFLDIKNSNLKKIGKNDLTEYKKFERLIFYGNKIEYLPGDLFEGFENLESLSFSGNQLRVIEPNIFDGLTKLKHVNIKGNINYDKCFSHVSKYSNASIDEIKKELLEKFCQRFKFVQDLQKSVQNFKLEVQNLKTSDLESKQKIQNLEASERDLRREVQRLKSSEENLAAELKKSSDKYGIDKDIKKLISDKNFKDFKITIKEEVFHVHKFLLAARSPTLAETFLLNPQVDILNLVDMPIDVFQQILEFIYTDELPHENDPFAAARRLKIKTLMNNSAEKIMDQVNPLNAVDVLILSNKYEHNKLRWKAYNEIKKKFPKIDFKDEWAVETEKVIKVIQTFMKKEEVIKKIEEDFKNIVSM